MVSLEVWLVLVDSWAHRLITNTTAYEAVCQQWRQKEGWKELLSNAEQSLSLGKRFSRLMLALTGLWSRALAPSPVAVSWSIGDT